MLIPSREVALERFEPKSRIIAAGVILLTLLVSTAVAQNHYQGPTPVTAYTPTFNVSGGYSFLSSQIPSAGRANLYGVEASARADFLPHWGVMLDAGYVRASNVLNTGHPSYTMTFMGGPVFYPIPHGRTRPFLHALAGAGLVDSAVPVNGTTYVHGYVERPAYAFGGGIEHYFLGPFGVRFTGDYLRTAYADANAKVSAQNNLRATGSLVFRMGHPGRRE